MSDRHLRKAIELHAEELIQATAEKIAAYLESVADEMQGQESWDAQNALNQAAQEIRGGKWRA